MFSQVFNSVLMAISYVWSIFQQVMTSFGFGGLLLELFGFYCVYRFLLKPLMGSRGSSDKVKKPKHEKDV